jgi:pimeloyl-ACP methyl ester carboxylesterase
MAAMADVPETVYAKSGDAFIAYQCMGAGGPIDYVCLPPLISNIDVIWECPQAVRFMRRLARLGRYVHFDKRGQGMSDRDSGAPTLDERVDDLLAVLDAAGVEKAALAGASEGGATAALFAATYPSRVSHVVMYGSFAALTQSDHYPLGFSEEFLDEFLPAWAATWGTPETLTLSMACASMADAGEVFVRWLNRYERFSSSPGNLLDSFRWIRDIDVTPILSSIQAPTLVIHSTTDHMVPIDNGRWMAEHIPGARFVEVAGVDHLPWFGDQHQVLSAVEEFFVGSPSESRSERALLTVLFTDIVESTSRAASLGDRSWRSLLDDHDHLARREIERVGHVVKSTGDGLIAWFDRPGRAIEAALSLRDELATIGLDIRCGLHTGEVELRDGDLAGLAVHIAARVCAQASAGEILVSRTVGDLVVGSGFGFESRGVHSLRGVPGRWQLMAVTAASP